MTKTVGWPITCWTQRPKRHSTRLNETSLTGLKIRLERVQVADGPGANRLEADLITSMYLGDRWEYLFHCGDLRLRAFGHVPRAAGRHWIEFPANDCWAFAQAS